MLYEDKELLPDTQESGASGNDTIYKSIAIGTAAILGVGAYKKGYLKPVIKPLLELADTVAKNGTENTGAIFGAIKDWTRIKHLTPAQAALQKTKTYSSPLNSIFRRDTSDSIFLKDVLTDLRTSLDNNNLDMFNTKKALRDTKDDLSILKQMITERIGNNPKIRANYANTELDNALKQFRMFSLQADESLRGVMGGSYALKGKYLDELIDAMSLSDDLAGTELQRTGYRKLTLKDIVDFDEETKKLYVKDSMKDKVNLGNIDFQTGKSFLDDLNDIFSDPATNITKDGNILRSEKWKDLIVDSALRVDARGNIIDYRMSKNQSISFLNSLATDFKIPLVQFNPFQMLGFDKIGRKNIFGGLVSPDQYAPTLTGRSGKYTIGQFLGETLGEEYDNMPIAGINGKVFALQKNDKGRYMPVQIEGKFKLYDVTNADSYMSLKPTVNAQRQMANLSLNEGFNGTWEEYAEILKEKGITDSNQLKFYEMKYKAGKFLDLGNQELKPESISNEKFRLDDFSIDEFTDNLIHKVTDNKVFWTNGFEYADYQEKVNFLNDKNFKTVLGEGFSQFTNEGKTINPRMYYISKQGITLKDIYNNKDLGMAGDYVKQFFAGRDMLNPDYMTKNFNERSTLFFNIINKLSEGIGSSSSILGFSNVSKGNVGQITGNLLLKRALPLYIATQIPGILNWASEPFLGEDENGNPDNLGKFIARGIAKFDLAAHRFMDTVHATDVFKTLGEYIPGSDQLNEDIPFIYAMGLGQTAEEREEYIENGYDPMRKGRFWGSGNTPWSGGKIMYWRPNWYNRVQADVKFSDSKWGSRQEYYENALFPNPVNPLAPINHFLTDKYHYEEKHYYDRPYLQTAPEGENIPIIGPLFGQTIGSIIKPQKKMHLEYWQNPLVVNPADELPSTLITEGKLYSDSDKTGSEYNLENQAVYQNIKETELQQQIREHNQEVNQNNYNRVLYNSAYTAKNVTKRTIRDNAGVEFTERKILPVSSIDTSVSEEGSIQTSILPIRTYDRYNHPYEVYSTPSGSMSIVDVPDEMNLYNVNKDLKKWSLTKIIGTQRRVDEIDVNQGADIPQGNDNPEIDNRFIGLGIKEEFNTLTDVAGLKGFAVRNFITGSVNQDTTQIETSSYAYSFKKGFWDMNLGGMGGNLSEISRRFMIKSNNDIERINNIRNTMPTWMPGSDYFVMDFKHGDPYSKIDNGEERLPGEGYERLHNIKDVTRLSIGSSYLGYSKEDIVKHLIGQEGYTSAFEMDTLDKGTKLHEKIEQEWLDAGIALKTEGEIKDNRNDIIGYYDAMVKDSSSKTGVAIVDIKTTSAKKLDEIRKSGKPLEHHQKQVNYYLWATNNQKSKGYIYYVDKENPDNAYSVGFDYNQKLLKESLNNLYSARADIRNAIDKGIISRGDLYSPIDKVRILADVAPYSQEFEDAKAEVAQQIQMTHGEQKTKLEEEMSRISGRVKKQKEPLRVYDYKFKTSNVKTETVTVTKIIDNNTIRVKEYGKEHSIKFAGVNVSQDNTTLYNPKEEEYTDDNGRKRKRKTGKTMNEAARDTISRYIKPGQKIKIQYDADETNKFKKDSTSSIRANIVSRGRSVNKLLIDKGLATEKEGDDSPAAIHARYTQGQIAFGSAMERITHTLGATPFLNKILQVRSPYEQYKNKEVYGKDFQSWNHPIRDILIPNLEKDIGNNNAFGLAGIGLATYVGTLFGKTKFGKLVGGTVGFTSVMVGKAIFAAGSTEDRDWRPLRRRKQEELNEYLDALKYVKNKRLYEQYKLKAQREDNFDVEKYITNKEFQGQKNKERQKELQDYKRFFKLDFEHRSRYNFKYGKPKYADSRMDKKELVSAINKEISELQSNRKVEKVPLNAIKAIEYKQRMEKTMFAYEPGDSLVNIMSALPKKERQYFKHFMNAPEEEKDKILRIAPSYLRRALQSAWHRKVDEKPTLDEYFTQHALPNENWVGWKEDVDLEDLKVKLVHANNLDPGEFDIWENNEKRAAEVNIPVPNIHHSSSRIQTQKRLNDLFRNFNLEDTQMSYVNSSNPSVNITINQDVSNDVSNQIDNLDIV